MTSVFHRSVLACAAILAISGITQASAQQQQQQQQKPLKKYESGTKDFWTKPPEDWFLGDETEAQKGLAPIPGQPTPTPRAELEKIIQAVKLPPGFKITIWADGVPQARQMALTDKGTMFVGTFDKGIVHAVIDQGGSKVVKPFIKGLR